MPNEIIGVQVEVGGNVEKSVGSMRQQLRAAITDLQNMQQEFGDISPQAQQAARAVAQLRDGIKDAQEVAELFNPEKTFQAVVNVASGIASGFAAAQGAMALFGVQSEAVEKTLLKVQAAMALAQGLAGVRAATEDFTRLIGVLANMSVVQKANAAANALAAGTMRLFGVATEATSVAFNTLKAAIVTTGIGALIVALGIAVNKLMDLTRNTDEAARAQKALNDELERTANTFADDIVDIYEQDAQLQIARAKAAGKTEKEIADIRKKANEDILTERAKNLAQQKVQGLEAAEAEKAYNKQVTDNEIYELGVRQKVREEAEAKEKEARAQSKRDKDAADTKQKEADKQKAEDAKALGELFQSSVAAQDESDIQAIEDKKQRDLDFIKYEGEIHAKHQENLTEDERKNSDARKQIAEAEKNQKLAAAQAVATGLQAFASLAGEQTVAGKALSIAAATISTYASAQAAYQSAFMPVPTYISPILGALAAGAAIASGLANIKRIVQVQVPGKGGSGGSVPAMSTFGAPPLTPQAQQTATVQLNQQSVNSIGNAIPARAYVVEADITESQKRANRIQEAAKFR